MFFLLAACTVPADSGDTDEPPWAPPEGGRIEVETPDHLILSADYHPASEEGRPAILLMPTQLAWPESFIERLHAHDWTVLTIGMRGSNESEGTPGDSQTVAALLDLEVFTRKLEADGYPNIAMLAGTGHEGVLNGYAYHAATFGESPAPVALGFFAADRSASMTLVPLSLVPVLPTVFVYSSIMHADFHEERMADNPGCWTFLGYPIGSNVPYEMMEEAPTMEEDIEQFYVDLWPE